VGTNSARELAGLLQVACALNRHTSLSLHTYICCSSMLHACMYVRICVCMYGVVASSVRFASLSLSLIACMYVCICMYILCMFVCMYILYVCMYVYTCVCMYIYA
jgi:hypothetical protein